MMLLANLLIPPPPLLTGQCNGASVLPPSLPAPTFHSLLDVAANLKIKFIIWDWPSWQRTVASFVSFVLFPALLSFLSYLHIIFTIYKYTTCLQVLECVLVVSASAPTVVTCLTGLWLVSFCFNKYYSSYSRASRRFLSKPSSAFTSQLLRKCVSSVQILNVCEKE